MFFFKKNFLLGILNNNFNGVEKHQRPIYVDKDGVTTLTFHWGGVIKTYTGPDKDSAALKVVCVCV